jgi:hypothetical protein
MRAKRDAIVTLADPHDRYNFWVGTPLRFKMSDSGKLIPLTRWEKACRVVKERWEKATRWFRPRIIVTAITDTGTVELTEQNWSWRRWRWL